LSHTCLQLNQRSFHDYYKHIKEISSVCSHVMGP